MLGSARLRNANEPPPLDRERRTPLPDSSELIIKQRLSSEWQRLPLPPKSCRLQSVVANPRLAEPRSGRL